MHHGQRRKRAVEQAVMMKKIGPVLSGRDATGLSRQTKKANKSLAKKEQGSMIARGPMH